MPITEQLLLQILPNASRVAGVFVPVLNTAIFKTPTSERPISPHLQVIDTFLCVPILIVFGHLRVRKAHQCLGVFLREVLLRV